MQLRQRTLFVRLLWKILSHGGKSDCKFYLILDWNIILLNHCKSGIAYTI